MCVGCQILGAEKIHQQVLDRLLYKTLPTLEDKLGKAGMMDAEVLWQILGAPFDNSARIEAEMEPRRAEIEIRRAIIH